MIFFPTERDILLSCLALLLCLSPSVASARLSAEASLNYTSYSISDNQNNRISANHFTQDYSLLYSKQGLLYNSRIGKYNVSLGYNWSALDTHSTSTAGNYDLSTNRGHIYYSGEILVDPKEVPLRFVAYSRDLTRNTFSSSEPPAMSSLFSNSGRLLGGSYLATGINDGLHIDSGATLVAGVKNGMTNGYNEILRHFPMIMLDYRDQIDRDLRSQTPIDTRLSRLAFVSLNKKDNWFHYRYITYNDYINPDNNFIEKQIQIGTVDQTLARRWIDFSNWIQVSTDLQFTKHDGKLSYANFQEVDLNFFTQAQRSNWEARSYNNFNRYREDMGKLTYRTTLPLNVYGTINPTLSWASRASYRESHDNYGAHTESLLGGYRVDAFKRSPFTFSHNLDVESSKSESSDLLVLSGGIETTSTVRLSRIYSVAASYNIKQSTQKYTSGSSDFLEQKLSLRAAYNPSNTVRITLRQDNEITNGTNLSFSSSVRDTSTSLPQYVAPRYGFVNSSPSHSYRSLTTLNTTWNPRARLDFGLTASEDMYYADNSSSSNITTISASVNYSNDRLKFSDSLNYVKGSYQLGEDTTTLSNDTTLSYYHSRNLDSRLALSVYRWTNSSTTNYSFNFEQQLNYAHFSNSGMSRKLFEFNETITHTNNPYQYYNNFYNNSRNARTSLSLGLKYYPLRQLVFSNGARYEYYNSLKNYSLIWYSSLAANFRLLQASVDYAQGKRQSDGLLEKKFTANVKKQF